jgi:EamA domain-containing membrane protein RarD
MSAIGTHTQSEYRPSWFGGRPHPILFGIMLVGGALLAGAVAAYSPRYAVGLIGGGALMLGVLMSPLFGACLLVGLVPATSGLAQGFPLPDLRLSEAVIGIVGVTLIATARRRDAVAWKPLDWLLLAYGAGWALLGVYNDVSLHQHLTIGQWGTDFGQLQFFLVYRGVRSAIRTSRDREIALGVAVLATIPVALLAILQEVNAPGISGLITTMTGGVSGTGSLSGTAVAVNGTTRATGPFSNWAALAGYLFPILLVMASVGLAGARPKRRRLFIFAAVVDVLALAVSDEQSVIICLIVGLVLLVRKAPHAEKLRRWMGIGGGVVAVVAAPVVVARVASELTGSVGTNRVSWIPQTIQYRWSVWTGQYFPAIGHRPLTGWGVLLPNSITWIAPESQYVQCLMQGGVPMLILFLALAWGMFRAVRAGITSSLNDPLQQAMCRALVIAVVAMMVVNFVWVFLSNGGMPQMLWALMALAVPVEHAGVVPHRKWSLGHHDQQATTHVIRT